MAESIRTERQVFGVTQGLPAGRFSASDHQVCWLCMTNTICRHKPVRKKRIFIKKKFGATGDVKIKSFAEHKTLEGNPQFYQAGRDDTIWSKAQLSELFRPIKTVNEPS
jgi:hypothetical protein